MHISDDLHENQNEAPNSQGSLVLHTHTAQSLWNSHWQSNKLGLIQFAAQISILRKAAIADDPYADWFLLKTYKEMLKSHEKLQAIEALAASHIESIRGIDVSIWQSHNPKRYALQFNNPFPLTAANWLIGKVDYISRQIMTMNNFGVAYDREALSRNAIKKIVIKVFTIPFKWHKLSISRQDITDNNLKAQKAIELFGDIPIEVINKEINTNLIPKKPVDVHEY